MATPHRRILVIGGGAAGTLVAVHLLRSVTADTEVRVIERAEQVGPGLAYGRAAGGWLLNNVVGRLSAVAGEPDHLLRWCARRGLEAGPDTFLPRKVYGEYLTDVLDEAAAHSAGRLHRFRGGVSSVGVDGAAVNGTGVTARLSCGWQQPADAAVLALGAPPPAEVPGLTGRGRRYAADPWDPELPELAQGAEHVLLVGSGLTMVDVVTRLADAAPGARFTAVSRHRLLPAVHDTKAVHEAAPPLPDSPTLAQLLRTVRARIDLRASRGGDWRQVVDGVRMDADRIWAGMGDAARAAFVRHLARQWEVHRHRMAPQTADRLWRLHEEGRFGLAGPDEVAADAFDLVVNCTGAGPFCAPGWNPVVDDLLAAGSARPDPLRLGLDADRLGRLVGADGRASDRLFAVGAALRGSRWEVSAIPDLRRQAATLAAMFAATRTGERTGEPAQSAGLGDIRRRSA